jgi:hypothetical protein
LPPLFGIDFDKFLGLAAVGSAVSFLGTLLGLYLKDFLTVRSLERWKQAQQQAQVFRKYRDPILLSSKDLIRRLAEVTRDYPNPLSQQDLLQQIINTAPANSDEDRHYLRYKLISSMYRLCSFLGWLELYRRDIVFLNTGQFGLNRNLEEALGRFRGALADGHLNSFADWDQWKDALIFREEQRAIGEAMIIREGTQVLGYGKFCAILEGDQAAFECKWIKQTLSLFVEQAQQHDFRLIRLLLMIVHLADLIRALQPKEDQSEFIDIVRGSRDKLRQLGQAL